MLNEHSDISPTAAQGYFPAHPQQLLGQQQPQQNATIKITSSPTMAVRYYSSNQQQQQQQPSYAYNNYIHNNSDQEFIGVSHEAHTEEPLVTTTPYVNFQANGNNSNSNNNSKNPYGGDTFSTHGSFVSTNIGGNFDESNNHNEQYERFITEAGDEIHWSNDFAQTFEKIRRHCDMFNIIYGSGRVLFMLGCLIMVCVYLVRAITVFRTLGTIIPLVIALASWLSLLAYDFSNYAAMILTKSQYFCFKCPNQYLDCGAVLLYAFLLAAGFTCTSVGCFFMIKSTWSIIGWLFMGTVLMLARYYKVARQPNIMVACFAASAGLTNGVFQCRYAAQQNHLWAQKVASSNTFSANSPTAEQVTNRQYHKVIYLDALGVIYLLIQGMFVLVGTVFLAVP